MVYMGSFRIILDVLTLVVECITRMIVSEPLAFAVYVLIAGALAAACWYGCCALAGWLWNKRFHFRIGHHLLCALSAILTFCFALTFICAHRMEDVSIEIINA